MATAARDTGVGKNGEVNAANPAFVDEGGVIVTMDNVVRAETAKNFAAQQILAGTNRFRHERNGIQVDNQTIIRSNFDLVYSYAVFDTSNGISITVPDYDLYHVVQVYDENGVTIGVVYASNTLEVSKSDCTVGEHVYLLMRTAPRSLCQNGIDELHARQDSVKAVAGSSTIYESAAQYDVASFNVLRNKLIKRAPTEGNPSVGFVSSLDQIVSPQHQIVNLAGWAGMPVKHVVYFVVLPADEGARNAEPSSVTFEAPELQTDRCGYWSFTVYNAAGWVDSELFHINSHNAEPNEDGTFTLNFNGGKGAKNNLNTTKDWTGEMRAYLPISVESIAEYKADFLKNNKVRAN